MRVYLHYNVDCIFVDTQLEQFTSIEFLISQLAKSSHFIFTYFLLIVEPYSVREARIHLRRIKDLLSTNFHLNAYSAVDHLSLSFLSAVAGVDVEGECMKCFMMFRQSVFIVILEIKVLKENS